MINTSNEYKKYIRDSRQFYSYAEITLADGTVLPVLDNSKIVGLKIDDGVSKQGEFSIGSAVINQLKLTINNFMDEYSNFDFTGAEIRPSIGLQLSESVETLHKGIFTVDEALTANGTLIITALDNMYKADKDFKDVVISFPCSVGMLLNAVCNYCGIPLATSSFDNDDYVIQSRPSDETITCREVISWIAQISGNFARIDVDGALELKWYDFRFFENETNIDGGQLSDYTTGDSFDGGSFTDYSSGDDVDGSSFASLKNYHHIYAINKENIAIDDVVITGISVTDNSEEPTTILSGQEGYVIAIERNPLIQTSSDAQAIANFLGTKFVGMRFRPLTASCLSDPSIEAGDIAYVTDRKQNTYQTLITNLTYSSGQYESISCDAETPSRNSSKRYSAETKTYIELRKTVQQKLTSYDLMVQQLNNLVAHSFGVYKSEEVLSDGSIIYYMHDKPTRAESTKIWKQTADVFAVSTDGGQTYNAGFDVNGNAVLNVLNAIGVNADWINAGTLKGVEVIAETGKIANMAIDPQGFRMPDESDNKFFRIQVGGTNLLFYDGSMDIQATDSFQTSGDGFNVVIQKSFMSFSINDGNNGFSIQASSNGSLDINVVDLSTHDYDDSKILINGRAVLSLIDNARERIDTLESKVDRMETFLETNFDYVP
jgi:hypothetical protein